MRTLVIYYSLTGNTRTLAMALAQELGADIEELRCSRYAPGIMGFVRAGYDSWRGRLPFVELTSRAVSEYDLVVVAGPIWAWHAATPVRAWLTRERAGLPRVAFLLTHGGSGGESSLGELEKIAGKAPVAGAVVKEADIKGRRFEEALGVFAGRLRAAETARG